MATLHRHQNTDVGADTGTVLTASDDQQSLRVTGALARSLAVLRIGFGLTFLWAFFDKLFALGYHTGYDQAGSLDRFGDAAWINGGSPTETLLTDRPIIIAVVLWLLYCAWVIYRPI